MPFKQPFSRLHADLGDVGADTLSPARIAHGFGALPLDSMWLGTWGTHAPLVAPSTNGRIYLVPIYVPASSRFDVIMCRVAVGGTVGALARLGLYRPGADGMPGPLIAEAGSTVNTEAAGNRTSAIGGVPGLTLPEGVYWGAMVPQGAPATQATFDGVNGQNPAWPIHGNAFANIAGFQSTLTTFTAALPDPAPALSAVALLPATALRYRNP
jgi:hypothetical protein